MKFSLKRTAVAPDFTGRRSSPLPEVPSEFRRKFGRVGNMVRAMFRASSASALDSWETTPIPPDTYIDKIQPVLVARSREQWSNNDYVKAFVRMVRQNVVGPKGITLQPKAKTSAGKLDRRLNKAIETAWRDWCQKANCDITGRLTFRSIQALCAETAARDGEFILRLLYGSSAGPYGFSVQVIDPQRLPVNYSYERYTNSSFIRNGIEYDLYGKPIAYHFETLSDSDSRQYYRGGRGFIRVPAGQVIHGFVTEMATQRRGLPWTSTGLFRLHHLEGFENAAVQNARASASKMGFIQYPEGMGPEVDEDTDVASTIDAEPLSFHELPEGATLATFDPQYPNGEYAVFHKAMVRGFAAGAGVQYNTLGNDLENVNFSSIRQGALDEREHWKSMQEWMIEDLMFPVFSAWAEYVVMAGRLKLDSGRLVSLVDLPRVLDVIFLGRRWPWIDPRADVDGALAEVRGGLNSFSAVMRERGRDPQEVITEWAQDVKDMTEALKTTGLTDAQIQMHVAFLMTGTLPKGVPGAEDPAKSADKPAPKKGSE